MGTAIVVESYQYFLSISSSLQGVPESHLEKDHGATGNDQVLDVIDQQKLFVFRILKMLQSGDRNESKSTLATGNEMRNRLYGKRAPIRLFCGR